MTSNLPLLTVLAAGLFLTVKVAGVVKVDPFFKSKLIALICHAMGICLTGEHFFVFIHGLSFNIFIKIQKLWVEVRLASVIS